MENTNSYLFIYLFDSLVVIGVAVVALILHIHYALCTVIND